MDALVCPCTEGILIDFRVGYKSLWCFVIRHLSLVPCPLFFCKAHRSISRTADRSKQRTKDQGQVTNKKRNLPPWRGKVSFLFRGPSWSQGLKLYEVRDDHLFAGSADGATGRRHQKKLLLLGRCLLRSGLLCRGLLSWSFLCHGAFTSFLCHEFREVHIFSQSFFLVANAFFAENRGEPRTHRGKRRGDGKTRGRGERRRMQRVLFCLRVFASPCLRVALLPWLIAENF